MKTAITPIAAAALAALAIAGCGGGNGGDATADLSSTPQAAAKAYAESYDRCGEEGAGVRAKLAYPARAAASHRDELADEEAPGGCTPEPQPRVFSTAIVPSRWPGISTVVQVSGRDCDSEDIPMIRVDGQGWLIDEEVFETGYFCS